MNSFPRILQALLVFAVLAPVCRAEASAQLKTRNVILITTDGLRWEEVFGGAEAALMNQEHGGVENTNALREAYWRETPEARRHALMPFLWTVIAKEGQILGNKSKGSVVKVGNGLNFSYPGYNEILAGIPDPRIDSNDKKPNPNVNVLAWLNEKPAFKDRVAAFCAWDVFPYILNRERHGLLVRAGWEPMAVGRPNPQRELLNQLVEETTPMWEGVIYDSLMFRGALDYFKESRPRVFYLAFGETDDWAHEGRYDHYLRAARRVDDYIKLLWETVQSMPEYRGRTTFIITTDHGRGSGMKEWKDHGKKIMGSEYIWLATIGPDTRTLGERTNTEPLTQGQVAATVAAFLGEDYHGAFPVARGPVRELMSK
ncbi:MAG TPA: alkaline phosphatase family protein [Verrucomicrobiae bacterium]|nr:alkaline phosphatase family protein [Verrucomicrobiae bacterium]